MKTKAILASLAVAATLVINPGSPADAATGAISCSVVSYGVKTPTPIANAGEGDGSFGRVQVGPVILDSQMVCSGSINGTAKVTGAFAWCHQETDHNPSSNPYDPDNNPSTPSPDPTAFECTGAPGHTQDDEAAYPAAVGGQRHPLNVHIVASAVLDGDSGAWLTPAGTPAPDICTVAMEGHGSVPTKLQTTVTCGSDVYEGSVVAGFNPVLGAAGDSFSDPSGNNPPTCATTMPNDPQCFRALVFEGNMTVSALPV